MNELQNHIYCIENQSNNEKCETTSIDDALNQIGSGKFNIFLIITGGLSLIALNSESFSIGYLLTPAQCDLQLTLAEQSLFLSIHFIGISCAQFLFGFLSDNYGRRRFLLVALIIAFLTSMAASFTYNFTVFIILRFLNGVCVACESSVIFVYLSEMVGEKYRARIILSASLFISVALMGPALVAWFIISNGYNWRLAILFNALPALPAIMCILILPESPKFLVMKHQHEQASEALRKIAAYNNQTTEHVKFKDEVRNSQGVFQQVFQLFNKQLVGRTFLICTIHSGIFLISCGLYLWYPRMMYLIQQSDEGTNICQGLELSSTIKEEEIDCNQININSDVYLQNIYIGFAYFLGYLFNVFAAQLMNFKHMLSGLMFLSGCSTLLIIYTTDKLLIDIGFILLMMLAGICISALNAAIVEIYPTHLRAMAVCLGMLAGRISTVAISNTLGYLIQWFCMGTFYMFIVIMMVCSTLVQFLPSKL